LLILVVVAVDISDTHIRMTVCSLIRGERPVEGGHLYFEINALCGKETVAMLRQENYTEVELIQDLYGKDRIVKAKI